MDPPTEPLLHKDCEIELKAESIKEKISSSEDIQSALVTRALDYSLPQQVHAISQARKDVSSQVASMQTVLRELGAQYASAKDLYSDLERQGNSLIAQISGLEEEGAWRRKQTAALQADINKLIEGNDDVQRQIARKEEENQSFMRQVNECEQRMAKYSQAVLESERESPTQVRLGLVQREITTLEDRIQAVKQAHVQMLGGKTEEQLITEMTQLEDSLARMTQAHRAKLDELKSLRTEVKNLEIKCTISNNKKSAKLKRLTKQLEEQKRKHEHFRLRIQHVEKLIQTATEKMAQ